MSDQELITQDETSPGLLLEDSSLQEIPVYVGVTWLKIKCNRYAVTPTGVSLADFIRKTLYEREWNPRINSLSVVGKFINYDRDEGYAYFPRYSLEKLVEYLVPFGYKIKKIYVDPIEPITMEANILPEVQLRENQIPVVEFLTNVDTSKSAGAFLPLALQTGSGKTISAIYSAVKLGYPALVLLQGLLDQWIQSILKFTDVDEKDICVLKGVDSLILLWHRIAEGYRPKFIIASTRTMTNYILEPQNKYTKIPSYTSLCETLGIGTKIIDECHLNFNTNSLIDMKSNIKVNIYLSATYQRSSRDGRRIFNMYFPDKLKFGNQFIKKYATVEMVYYHLCIPPTDLGRFKSDRGYNHAVYEKYLRKHKQLMKLYVNEVIYPLLNSFFCEKAKLNQHCLILVKTRDFAEELYSRLAKKIVNTSMSIFFSGDPGIYGLEENLHKDIIISTISSCGTGRDIKGLKTCICTVSMSSQPQSLQCLGRLREIPGEDVYYVDLCNEEIHSHRSHAQLRIQYFKNRVKELTEFKIR